MEATIKNGRLSGMTINRAFQVQLNNGDNPQISPTVDLSGMPIDVAKQLILDALKVRGRGPMRGMSTETLKNTYSGVISWRALYSKTGAHTQSIEVEMSDDELDVKIKELQAKRDSQKDDFDTAVDDAKAEQGVGLAIKNLSNAVDIRSKST